MKILSELSTGRELSMILDGSKNSDSGIRGGSKGCCRLGTSSFKLGCRVMNDNASELLYEIEIEVDEHIFVKNESLYLVYTRAADDYKLIFQTKPAAKGSADIGVKYNNAKRGMNPDLVCIRSASVLSQMKTKMPTDSNDLKKNISYIEAVISALTEMLFLNPVASSMRDYVRETDTELKVDGENISAVLKKLCSQPDQKETLLNIVGSLPENEIADIDFIDTPLHDVIFALREKYGSQSEQISAKILSDGTLRCIAIVAAMITVKENSLVIIEEIDNGIHPGRAQSLIDNISKIGKLRKITVIITTHNASLLNSLSKENLSGVSIVYREKHRGSSEFISLIDVDDYAKLLAKGGLGDAVVNDSLIRSIKNEANSLKDFSWMKVSE